MSGRNGKRAKSPGICFRCGKPIVGAAFERSRQGDSHCMNPTGSYPCVPPKPASQISEAAERWIEKAHNFCK